MKSIVKIGLLLAVLFPMAVYALGLQEAKSSGLVGEQANGYLGVVESRADVEALVADINAKRRAHYQRIATANKLSLEQVAKLAGEKAVAKTPSGGFINTGSGWQRK